ncbi:MAG: FAD-dependent oxidoreductase [Candidatus Bathyarchaeota archaeon]|nr:MAG: FAD-dependent oxidoreductase [Candidatus Bathyarchaeota archaeon]
MSGYPDYMQESLELVKKTRPSRVGKALPEMTAEEKEKILRDWHPDFKMDQKRELKIGPSKGVLMPHEVADTLEAHPIIKPRDIDLTNIDHDVDVLIIGAGGAGLSAALLAQENGVAPDKILMIQKLRLGDANSKMSQGGIQAADAPDDNPAIHYLDVIGGGHYENKPELVELLVKEGPDVIKWHEELGVMYDKLEDGTMQLAPGGGTSRKRMHSCKDYTGLEITRVLVDEFLSRGISYLELTSAVELILDDKGQVVGAVLYDMDSDEYKVCRAKATVLATGGFGRLHIQGYETTNHYGATNDGVVMAYHAGAVLRDLDSTQFHPTGAAYPEQIVGQLCTEKLRGRGAQPLNKHGELFVYPLETRDVEASALIRECYGRDNGIITPTGMRGVWLDTPLIDIINGEGTIEREFAAMLRNFNKFGINIREEPMLVFPTLHYQNGGVEINAETETSIPGLFAAGEVCGGVHGKNRLMGNSQLDLYVFGRRAGRFAAERAKTAEIGKLTLNHLDKYEKWLREAGVETDRKAPILLPEYRGKKTIEHQLKLL